MVGVKLQDTDFNVLLQDIASGPTSLSKLNCKPDEAQASSRPSSEGEKDNMADSASEDVAAASVSAERKSFRQRFNPMRGFLSRRPSSVSLQAPLCLSSVNSPAIRLFWLWLVNAGPCKNSWQYAPGLGASFSHRLASAGRQALDGRDVDLSRFSRTIVLYAKVPFVMFQDRPQLTWVLRRNLPTSPSP